MYIYIYTSDPGEGGDGVACSPESVPLSCPRKEILLKTRSPEGHLGEMRTEAEECEPSPCVSEALKL